MLHLRQSSWPPSVPTWPSSLGLRCLEDRTSSLQRRVHLSGRIANTCDCTCSSYSHGGMVFTFHTIGLCRACVSSCMRGVSSPFRGRLFSCYAGRQWAITNDRVRTCACSWGEHMCGHGRACRSSLGKKFYEPLTRFIKYRTATSPLTAVPL